MIAPAHLQNSVPPSGPTDKTTKKKSKNKQKPPTPRDEDTYLILDCLHLNVSNPDDTSYNMCVDTKDISEEDRPSEDKQPVAEKWSSVGALLIKETETNHPKKGRNRVEKGKVKANSQAAVEHLPSLNSNNTREMVSGPVTNPEPKPRGNTNLDTIGRTDEEVTLCETFNKFMAGSVDKRSGPVPEKDRDKKEVSTTSSVSVMAQDGTKTKLRGLRSCANCLLKEPSPLFYQKCRLCKTQKMKLVRFYCGRECQVTHWKAVHQAEHAAHAAQTSAH
uniref:MYND-type domain-containing protein n=1 Tax=Timema poppense TaxID=170557 RepID=A0A7R9HAE8_TIMPO|nr:unnamed protein product [Timema poppensis]